MSGEHGGLVRNAADPDQVRHAARTEKDRARRDRDDLRWVMSDRRGRRLVRRWLHQHRLFETITVQSSLIYALSGRRDAGLEMLAEVTLAGDELYLQMETEAREDARRDADAIVASRTAPAAAQRERTST